ncbi:PWWP domain-containing DNA repair factor 3A isoform X1 [Camelus dromedarius]|nr:PWWP domain-containing DNA repair factor 3A isoform X1 [Camelus dromedarius]XP_031293941.1 PWWP domain-containing DNA repair factor 3A isoform X1 [Camelus dromedarius]
MTDAKYVLCRWKKRLWPAKVLSGNEKSAKNKRKKEFFLNVQILSLDKKITVRSSGAKILKKAHIEGIASSLASPNQVPVAPLEELAYRRSLRVALDVLNERTHLCQESSLTAERPTLSPRVKPVGLAPLLRDPSSLPLLHEDMSGQLGPERKGGAHKGLSASPTHEKDPTCKVDPKKRLGTGGSPPNPVVSSAGGRFQDSRGSRVQRKTWSTLSKRRRNPAQERGLCQKAPLSSEGAGEESEMRAGSLVGLHSPPRAAEEGPLARESHLGVPLGGPSVPDAHGRPAERLCPGGSQRPRVRVAPRSPAEETGSVRLTEKALQSSEEARELDPVRSVLEEDEEDEEPPRILLYREPRSFEVGMLVWLKYQKYPFWPAVVKSVRRRDKKASVLFIEGNMNPKGRGITVALRRLKHFDCKEKQVLLDQAKEDFDQAIGWCVSLITDYRVRLGCGSFAGSFLEYYSARISYPVRKSIQQDVLGTRFPQLSKGDPEEPVAGSPPGRRQACKKVLPDRSRAARDRANQKLVEYIVKARGAESHLRAILKNRKPSRWLKTFMNSGQYVTCVETYLEDEEQLDLVVKYLQGVCQEAGSRALAHANGDRVRFVLDVLLPEAIICAISAVDAVDYKTAEEKYIRGPSLGHREKEIFDNQLLEERNRRC